MLPAKFRLTRDKDFDLIFKKGRKSASGCFRIAFLGNNLSNSRFGVVVSNKVSKKAVKRNLLKRQIRGIIASNLAKFSQNNDIIISLLPICLDKSYDVLANNLLALLKKNRLI
jgi:ribonuclease P protein component